MQSVLETKDAAKWNQILHDAGVPAGLVLNVDKTRRLDQIIDRGMVRLCQMVMKFLVHQ